MFWSSLMILLIFYNNIYDYLMVVICALIFFFYDKIIYLSTLSSFPIDWLSFIAFVISLQSRLTISLRECNGKNNVYECSNLHIHYLMRMYNISIWIFSFYKNTLNQIKKKKINRNRYMHVLYFYHKLL